MAADLSPRARRELDALAQVRGPRHAEAILISHQRRDVGGCLCGWSELGKSHAGHQVMMLREAGLLVENGCTAPDHERVDRVGLPKTERPID